MNSTSEKKCLDDPHSFRPHDDHRSFEVWVGNQAATQPLTIVESPLEEKSIDRWLQTPFSTIEMSQLAFRLLICAPREIGRELVLPVSPDTYRRIARSWGFPSLVLCAVRQPFSFSAYFSPVKPGRGEPHQRGNGLVLRFDSHWECECMIVVVQDPVDKQIRVLVAGLSSDLIPRFTAMIRDAMHLLCNPLFLPVLIMSELCQNQTDWLGLVHPDLEDIQRRLGMANWKYAADSPFYGPSAAENLLSLDLPGIVTKLNRMSDSICFQDQIALALIEMLEEMEKKLAGGISVAGIFGGDGDGEAEKAEADEEIGHTIAVLLRSLKGCQRRISYRTGTIHGLINTVYTLIAQRDSYLSLDVAFHTRRDSTDMRMIAAVTLFFLPGMFIATLFSTSFFDFQAETVETMLSPYHWIYWTTSAGATLAVMFFWFLYAMKKKTGHDLPDLMGINSPPNPIENRSYNTTDVPEQIRRVRRFAGW